MAHLVRAFLVVTAIIAATLLPFFPGGYDPLSRPLAGLAWVLGWVGLLLVPIGGLWLWFSQKHGSDIRPPRWLLWITLGTCVFIALVMALIAFASSGPLLAVGTGTVAAVPVVRMTRQLRASKSGAPIGRMTPAILAVAPLLVLAAQSAFVEPIASHARNRVIANSAPLIAEIERYHARHGEYPLSLFSLYGDYKPATVGVQRYFYERSGDAYNVIFEEPSLGPRRFVVFNPRDKQRLTVHESDRLLLNEAELDADNAGYTIVQPLPQPHWKVFSFLS